MQIGVLGINHKIASLQFREEIARAANSLSGEKALFFPHPIVVLSTCNRTEIYFGGDDLAAVHTDLLCHLRKYIEHPFEHRLYSYFGIDCFAHLAKVTAGLDSAIVAETEIQGQVKVAYTKAAALTRLPSCMHYVFQNSLRLGKYIRNDYELEGSSPTLFQAIWQLSKEKIPTPAKTLFIGYSETNRSIIHYFQRRGLKTFSLITRNPSEITLAGCTAYPRSHLAQWSDYQLIICAASSQDYLLRGSPSSSIIFDLSVPRNIDPQMTTYNIEQVNAWIEKKQALRSDLVQFCEEKLFQETQRLAKCYREKVLLEYNRQLL